MDSKFTAYIVSNGSKEYYPDNTLSNFSVKFPFSLDLPTNENEKWAISLNSIGLSSKFGSKYEKYNSEPLMFQILSLVTRDICRNSTIRPQCENTILEHNKWIMRKFNKCYFGSEVKENCHPEPLSQSLRGWMLLHLRHSWDYDNGQPFSILKGLVGLHQTSYYHNPLETATDLKILIDQLKEDGFNINKLNDLKYEISIDKSISPERILFIRKDFLDHCTYSQNTSFIDPNTPNEEKRSFDSIEKARRVNGNTQSFSSHNYQIFVFNVEFNSLTLEIKKFMRITLAIPNLVKIKCNNIRSQVFNNTYSNDIEVIKPVFEENGSHYFHEFENPVFVPLLNSCLSDLNFELTNEYDEQLNLSTGLPTIVSATFKKMAADYKCFNIRITPGQDSPENTSSSFKNILPNTFTFNTSWFVGLKDITFPNQFKNLPSDDNNEIVVVKLTNELKVIQNERHRIPISNLKANQQEFIRYLNSKIQSINAFSFEIDSSNFVSIKTKTNVLISMSKHLAQFLGFLPLVLDSEQNTTQNYWKHTFKVNSTKQAETPVTISLFRPAFLMVYLDFVELTLISGKYTNIVKIVPVKIERTDLECQTIEFKSIEYRKLGKMILSEINTEIRDPSGKLVQFDSDKLTLHIVFTNNPMK